MSKVDDLKKKGLDYVEGKAGDLIGSLWKKKEELHLDGVDENVTKVLGTKFQKIENNEIAPSFYISREAKISGQKVTMTVLGSVGKHKVEGSENEEMKFEGFFIKGYQPDLDAKNIDKLLKKYEEKGVNKLSKDEQVWLNYKDSMMMAEAVASLMGEEAGMGFVVTFNANELVGNAAPSEEYKVDFSKANFTEEEKKTILEEYRKRMVEAYGEERGNRHFEAVMQRSGIEIAKENTNTEETQVTVEQTVVKQSPQVSETPAPASAPAPEQQKEETPAQSIVGESVVQISGVDVKRTVYASGDGKFGVTFDIPVGALNMEDLKKKALEGKLSVDEQIFLNQVSTHYINQAYKAATGKDELLVLANYTEAQLLGKEAISASVDVKSLGLTDEQIAVFQESVKQGLTLAMGAELGEKYYNDFTKASGMDVATEMRADAKAAGVDTANAVAEANQRNYGLSTEDVKEAMKTAEAQKLQNLLKKKGVKVENVDEMAEKLVGKYGAEMAYAIALKCVIEPKNAMEAMGGEFMTSGKAIAYFADLDLNDEAIRTKVETMTGKTVPVQQVTEATTGEELPNQQEVEALGVLDISEGPKEIKEPAPAPTPTPATTPTPKSPAEKMYDDLLAKKREKDPDAQFLTLGDLKKAGVQITEQNLTRVMSSFPKEQINDDETRSDLIHEGFGSLDSTVGKEFAVALLDAKINSNLLAMAKGRDR